MIVLREPLVGILLERGSFTYVDTKSVAVVLASYSGAIIALAMGNLITPIFYAKQDTTTPAVIQLLGMIVYIILINPFVNIFSFQGPALDYSIIMFVNIFIMLYMLKKKIQMEFGYLLKDLWKVLLSTIVSLSFCYPIFSVLSSEPDTIVSRITVLAIVSTVFACFYLYNGNKTEY